MRLERRQLRDQMNPFEAPEAEFRNNFRLSKNLVHDLIAQLRLHVPGHARSTRLPFFLRVLTALHFLAKGSYQHAVGSCFWISVSQTSVSRSVNEICHLIVNVLMPELVKFPTEAEEKSRVKQDFYNKSGFRGVLGCIDGSHVAIVPPPATDEDHPPHVFLNRKGFYSLNVMVISDSNCRILACDARFPGSVHDSAVWKIQQVRNHLKQEYNNGDSTSILIGDSGYGLEPWLFTPFSVVVNGTPEARFNELLRSTRNVVERTFGILKGRWRALLQHRVLHYHPADAAYIIYAAVVLHNIAIGANLPIDEDDIVYDIAADENVNEVLDDNEQNILHLGRLARANYIRRTL